MPETPKKSHWLRNLTILIVIGLLIWEYALPMFYPDLMTPSDYIKEAIYDNDFSEALWSMTLTNLTTGAVYDYTGFYGYEQTMSQYHTYSLGIETEGLPHNLFSSLTWQVQVYFFNHSASPPDWELGGLFAFKIPGYETLYKSSWYMSEDSVFINYEMTYTFTMSLLDFDGQPIHVKNTPTWTSQVVRLNDYLESVP
jgi:hypothetical protein